MRARPVRHGIVTPIVGMQRPFSRCWVQSAWLRFGAAWVSEKMGSGTTSFTTRPSDLRASRETKTNPEQCCCANIVPSPQNVCQELVCGVQRFHFAFRQIFLLHRCKKQSAPLQIETVTEDHEYNDLPSCVSKPKSDERMTPLVRRP